MRDLTGQTNVSDERRNDSEQRRTTVRLLRLLIAASLVLPLLLFTIASWLSYRDLQALNIERIDRTQAVMQEHALKVFQSLTLALDTIDDMLRNRTAQEIEADGQRIHARIRQINSALPEVQSIWIFGPAGHPQVITREYPAPTSQDFGQNDYFSVPRDGYRGIYVGEIHASVTGGKPYFTFSRARYMADGRFAGVIELSLLPNDFNRFYARLANTPGLQFALIRSDGLFLARYPEVESKPSLKTSTSAETILVVEDDADVRAYIVEALTGMKYHVLEAANGEAALKLMSGYVDRIDLLLTDVVMPGMNGRKLSDTARETRRGLKVLFMTGYSRNAIIHQGRLDPGVELIQKAGHHRAAVGGGTQGARRLTG